MISSRRNVFGHTLLAVGQSSSVQSHFIQIARECVTRYRDLIQVLTGVNTDVKNSCNYPYFPEQDNCRVVILSQQEALLHFHLRLSGMSRLGRQIVGSS